MFQLMQVFNALSRGTGLWIVLQFDESDKRRWSCSETSAETSIQTPVGRRSQTGTNLLKQREEAESNRVRIP